jgi:hypothetical protein
MNKPTTKRTIVPSIPYTQPQPTFTQTLKECFAFGTGSAIANSLVRSFTGYSQPTTSTRSCTTEEQNFRTCEKNIREHPLTIESNHEWTDGSPVYCYKELLEFSKCLKEKY